MRPSFRTIVVSTLTLVLSPTLASAAEVRVLSVGSTQIAAKAIATEFEKQTRHKVTATPNTSGAIAAAALAKLGILDEIKGKTRHAALAVGGELVAKGEVELGLFNLSEIPKGVTVAGALPVPLQGYTVYEAAVLSKGSTDQAATAFVKYLASAPAAAHWEAAKLEPATTYMPTRAGR